MLNKLCKHPIKNELLSCTRILSRNLSTNLEEEYSSEPHYPEILDMSTPARKARKKQEWHDKIKNLGTVEEKLIEINMPKFYGWRCNVLREGEIPYNALSYAQHITRTHFVHGLPKLYESPQLNEAAKEYLSKIKTLLTEALIYELQRELPMNEDAEPHETERARSLNVVEQLSCLTRRMLGPDFPHLLQLRADPEPRIEAGWSVGGMAPSASIRHNLKCTKMPEETLDAPRDRFTQYIGRPLLQLRSILPLLPVVDRDQCQGLEVPLFSSDPDVLTGEPQDMRHITNIPGFWPNDQHQFGVLSFHSRSHMSKRPLHYGVDEHVETLHTQAILASYGWLLPQACHLGFSTFNDLTYPLVTQTVITDGQLWSLYAYQMNTTSMYGNSHTTHPVVNMCWGSSPLRLFERIEDGKLIGLNDDVLTTILKLFMVTPEERVGVEMRPYLDPICPTISKIDHTERRVFLERVFKHLMSNRPRHRVLPEIHFWERIYKIKFKTRPMDARRKPYELWQNPWRRRLDEHAPMYIPKVLRKDPKQKFEKTYYP